MFKRLLFLALLVPSVIQPFISFDLLMNPEDGKLVLIIGDMHAKELDEFNTENVKHLIKHVLKGRNYSTKAKCFLEMPKKDLDLFKDIESNHQAIQALNDNFFARSFFELCFNAYNNNFFNFEAIEPRGYEAELVTGIIYSISELVYEDIDIQSLESKKQDPFNFNLFKYRLSNYSKYKISISDYLQKINGMYEELKVLTEKHVGFASHSIFKENAQKFLASIFKITTLFKNMNKSKSLFEGIIDLFKDCRNLGQAIAKYLEISDIFKFDYLYADLYFLDAVLEDQKENTKTVLIVGEAHRKSLQPMFISIGYKVICTENLEQKMEGYRVYNFDPSFIHKLSSTILYIMTQEDLKNRFNETQEILCTIFNQIDGMNPEEPETLSTNIQRLSLEEKKQDSILCNECNKDLTLIDRKRCACKTAYYCNDTCRTKDWPKHKASCGYKK